MSAFPCPTSNSCLPACPDGIESNYSSEAPDGADFFAVSFFANRPRLNANPDDYITPNGFGFCFAPTAQGADDCALVDAQNNAWRPWRAPPGTTHFFNAAQTCTVTCPDGFESDPYTVAAGTFQSIVSQAEADAIAMSYCKNRAFESRSCAPGAITLDATEVGETTALLNGQVYPNYVDTFAYFEWGTTTAYGNFTPIQGELTGAGPVEISQGLLALTAGTYHYRVVAINANGTAFGEDKTFAIVSTCAIDWNNLVWTIPVQQFSIPPGVNSAVLNGPNAQCSLSGASGGAQDAELHVEARYTYTGNSVPVKLHLVVSGASGSIGNFIGVYHDGNLIFNTPGIDAITDGTYDYYFTIPISAAQEILIIEYMNAGSTFPGSGAGALTTNLTITCDCGVPVYQVDGYDAALAAAIVTLAGGANPSSLPEWDGQFRYDDELGGYTSRPQCYSINGTDAYLTLTESTARLTTQHCPSFWAPSAPCGFHCNTGYVNTTTPTDIVGVNGLGAVNLANDNAGGLGNFFNIVASNPICAPGGGFTNAADPTFTLGAFVLSVSTI